MGFLESNGEDKPQCVLCCDILSNECMKPAKLKRLIETKHKEYKDKPLEFFNIKLQELQKNKKSMRKVATGSTNENAVLASYKVSLMIGKFEKFNVELLSTTWC